jgi:hypothetical protein
MWEFETFLSRIGQGISVESARDLDVLAFVQGWWLPFHLSRCQTWSSRGEKVASASAVKGVIQHIAKSYSMLSRQDEDNRQSRKVFAVIAKVIRIVCMPRVFGRNGLRFLKQKR